MVLNFRCLMSSYSPPNNALNPFESAVVRDPKECGASVSSLNRLVVDGVMQRFRLLTSNHLPKSMRRPAAQLVLSPSPGYGKSHLIGRLYHELGNAATIVHQTPFQAPSLVWQTVLNNTINELSSIDESEPAASRWKVELLANAALCNSVAELIRNGTLKFRRGPDVVALLEQAKVSLSAEHNDPIGEVIRERFFDTFRPLTGDELFGIRETKAWLTAFYQLATAGRQNEAFRTGVAWLRYEPFDPELAQSFGFRPDQIPRTEDVAQINQECWLRLLGLCRWSSTFRPFLFCFDQTEDYADRKELATTFGTMIRRMTDELPGQLTLVTANQSILQSGIWSFIDSAGQARFAHPPMELKGIRRSEAREFIAVKLRDGQIPEEAIGRFADETWLDRLFPGDSQISARNFMSLCRERWDGKPAARESLDAILEDRIASFEATPKRLGYNADAFRWFVADILGESPMEKEPPGMASLKPHAETAIRDQEGRWVAFSFFRELQHQQWKSLATRCEAAYTSSGMAKLIVFRTPDQPEIPKPTWKVTGPIIREALGKYVHLIFLELTDVALLYASRELYLEARAGDLPDFSVDAVLEFLRGRLSRLRTAVLGPVSRPPRGVASEKIPIQNENLRSRIRTLVSQRKLIAAQQVVETIGPPLTLDHLKKLTDDIPEVRKIAHPNHLTLVWQELSR
jgi:hypothetical protein